MAALELSRARSGWQRARAAPRPPAGTRQRSTRSAIGCTPAWVSRARVARGGALAAHAPCRPPRDAGGGDGGSSGPGLGCSRRRPDLLPACLWAGSTGAFLPLSAVSRCHGHRATGGSSLTSPLRYPAVSAAEPAGQRGVAAPVAGAAPGSGGRELRGPPAAPGSRGGTRPMDIHPTAPAPRPAAWDNRDERYQQLT